eukprot:COSAG02_NODE_19435_length_882_cov_1.040868_2_plen_190_part_01
MSGSLLLRFSGILAPTVPGNTEQRSHACTHREDYTFCPLACPPLYPPVSGYFRLSLSVARRRRQPRHTQPQGSQGRHRRRGYLYRSLWMSLAYVSLGMCTASFITYLHAGPAGPAGPSVRGLVTSRSPTTTVAASLRCVFQRSYVELRPMRVRRTGELQLSTWRDRQTEVAFCSQGPRGVRSWRCGGWLS